MAEDNTGLMWSDPAWPWRPLNRVTALQYFEHSPFYDPNSNNAAARAQNLDPANEAVLRSLPPDRPEFVLAEVQEPHLFVVRRQLRAAPPTTLGAGGAAAAGRAATQAVYYILGDAAHTYQAPSLHAAINARLRRCMHFVRVGFGRFKRELAPLPKLLSAHERQEAQRAQQEQREAREREKLLQAAATGVLGADVAADVAAAGTGAAGSSGAGPLLALQSEDVKPVEVPEVLSASERRHWERTDEIIMNVLRRYQAPKLAAEEGAPGPAPPAAEEAQKQQQQQPPPPDIKPPSGAPPSIKQEQPQQQPQPPLQRATPPLPDAGVDGSMRQPAARGPPLPAAAAAAAAPGVPGRASQPGQQPGVGSGPSCSQGSVQPSGGSVLTASRAPKVRIKLPRSSAGGGGSGGGAAPGQQQGDGGDGPAAKRARQ